MPVLLLTVVTYSTCPYSMKKAPTKSSSTSLGTPCKVILFLRVPIYSVCILTDLVVRMLPASAFASSSGPNKMFHIAYNLLANTFSIMFRHWSASSIPSLPTPTNFLVFTSNVSREIVLFEIAS